MNNLNGTHTFATLSISPAAFNEIWTKLQAAGYQDSAVQQDDGPLVVDMHGIGLVKTEGISEEQLIKPLAGKILKDHMLNGIVPDRVMLHIVDLEMYLKRARNL